MAYIINVPEEDWSTQTVVLGKQRYRLELKYKNRTKRWYMTLTDNDGVQLISERKIVPDIFLTEPFDMGGFEGAILCERSFSVEGYPSRDNLGRGKAFELKYMTKEELRILADVYNGVV